MPAPLTISAEWEQLDSGSPEEKACFAALGIYAHEECLTEGIDSLANRLRQNPLLSAYHLAEWLAWNWWRLRWEPRSKSDDWAYAHRMATIGGGYIWPNITIFSDGERTALIAKPTEERRQTPFRYISDRAAVVAASAFEAELDLFIDQVIERLRVSKIADSNLNQIWKGVCEERSSPQLSEARKLEALLGKDPDESDPHALERLISDAKQLGIRAVEEVAANYGQSGRLLTADDIQEMATGQGFKASPRSVIRLHSPIQKSHGGTVAAWKTGADLAQYLRRQEGLGDQPISDGRLAEMMGVRSAVLSSRVGDSEISFALDESPTRGRVVLRSKWQSGRRFELARILGDRISTVGGGKLFPATRAYTYRQKMQRSFAAEFLSPFHVVDNLLDGDYSDESQQDVAQHFQVSPLTIRTLLVNHGRLEREDLDGDFEPVAA